MSAEWPSVQISEACELIIDCVNKTAKVVDVPTPYKMIRTTNVRDGWVDTINVRYVEEDTYKKWTRRGEPRNGDVILTREAPLGEVGILRDARGIFLGQRLVMYRANPTKLDNRFLLYSLLDDDLQGQIKAFGSGSTVEHMRVPDCEKLILQLPSLKTQQKIGSILSAYDDLIENNTRRIKILEEMARMIYRNIVETHCNASLQSAELPDGWEIRKIRDVAEVNADSIKKKSEPEYINYVDIASVTTGQIDKIEQLTFNDAPGRARRIVKHGDVIWSMVRPNRKSYSMIIQPVEDMIVSTGFAVLTAVSIPYTYLFHAVTTDDFVGYLINHATGSAYPAVNASDFENAEILVPPKNILDDFHKTTESIFLQCNKLQMKNQNLRQTRDLLLPKLISGEVAV